MSATQHPPAAETAVEPSSETTRLGGLFSFTSIAFVLLCTFGLGMGLAYVFGVPIGGRRLIEGQYYWVFIGTFLAAAFIALPAVKSHTHVPIYDIVAAAVGFGICMWFSMYAWEIVQAGWTNFYAGVVLWLLMLEIARRSGGIPFLLVVLVLGLENPVAVPLSISVAEQARLEAAEAELPALTATYEAREADLVAARDARQTAEVKLRDLRQAIAPAQRALSEARNRVSQEAQASERAAMKRDTSGEALTRAEADLAIVNETLAMIAPEGPAEDEAALETRLAEARTMVAEARTAEIEARGRLTDITRGREQAAARRDGLERDIKTWSGRITATEERVARLIERRQSAASDALAAKARPEQLAAEIENRSNEVEALETERKRVADQLAEKEAAIREAEQAARAAANAASEARENLAGWKVKLENAEGRLEESVEIARNNFQRTPEGLLAIAEAGLEEETMGEFTPRDAERRADELRRTRDQLGGVNMNAEEEAEELEERLGSQVTEKEDLVAAIAKLRQGVDALNAEGRERLLKAFEQVNEHFKALFTALFRGGQAELRLVDADDPLHLNFVFPGGYQQYTAFFCSLADKRAPSGE